MWTQLSWVERILGVWAVAAGVSLVFTFVRQYHARARYAYLPLLGAWALLYGLNVLRGGTAARRWLLWALFLLGVAAMVRDSATRYRETSTRLREERLKRLHDRDQPPS